MSPIPQITIVVLLQISDGTLFSLHFPVAVRRRWYSSRTFGWGTRINCSSCSLILFTSGGFSAQSWRRSIFLFLEAEVRSQRLKVTKIVLVKIDDEWEILIVRLMFWLTQTLLPNWLFVVSRKNGKLYNTAFWRFVVCKPTQICHFYCHLFSCQKVHTLYVLKVSDFWDATKET